MISEVEETEIFKICLEYWNALASDLYRESPFSGTCILLGKSNSEMPVRRQLYNPVLSKVMNVLKMIEMAFEERCILYWIFEVY